MSNKNQSYVTAVNHFIELRKVQRKCKSDYGFKQSSFLLGTCAKTEHLTKDFFVIVQELYAINPSIVFLLQNEQKSNLLLDIISELGIHDVIKFVDLSDVAFMSVIDQYIDPIRCDQESCVNYKRFFPYPIIHLSDYSVEYEGSIADLRKEAEYNELEKYIYSSIFEQEVDENFSLDDAMISYLSQKGISQNTIALIKEAQNTHKRADNIKLRLQARAEDREFHLLMKQYNELVYTLSKKYFEEGLRADQKSLTCKAFVNLLNT